MNLWDGALIPWASRMRVMIFLQCALARPAQHAPLDGSPKIHRVGKQDVSRFLGNRPRFTGEVRLVACRGALENFQIRRNLFSRREDYDHAALQRFNRNCCSISPLSTPRTAAGRLFRAAFCSLRNAPWPEAENRKSSKAPSRHAPMTLAPAATASIKKCTSSLPWRSRAHASSAASHPPHT